MILIPYIIPLVVTIKSSGYLYSLHSQSFLGSRNSHETPTLFVIKSSSKNPSKMSIYTKNGKSCMPLSYITGGSNKFDVEMNKSGEIRIKQKNKCASAYHGDLKIEPCSKDLRQMFIWISKRLFVIQNDVYKHSKDKKNKSYSMNKDKKSSTIKHPGIPIYDSNKAMKDYEANDKFHKKGPHHINEYIKRITKLREDLEEFCKREEVSKKCQKLKNKKKNGSDLNYFDKYQPILNSSSLKPFGNASTSVNRHQAGLKHDQDDLYIVNDENSSDDDSYEEETEIQNEDPIYSVKLPLNRKCVSIRGEEYNSLDNKCMTEGTEISENIPEHAQLVQEEEEDGFSHSNDVFVHNDSEYTRVLNKPYINQSIQSALPVNKSVNNIQYEYRSPSTQYMRNKPVNKSINNIQYEYKSPSTQYMRKRGAFAQGLVDEYEEECKCANTCVINPRNGKCYYSMDWQGKLTPLMKTKECCKRKKSLCDLKNTLDRYICELTFMNDYSFFSKFLDEGYSSN